jgi:predicted metalloprotease with PDZ domain
MKTTIAVSCALLALAPPNPVVKDIIQYTLRVDSTDLSGWDVEIRLRSPADTFRMAMAAHPEYDGRYFRYVTDFTVEPRAAVVSKVDSAVWQVVVPKGAVRVRYRIALPPPEPLPRAAWRPFLTPTGGLVGGPHAFMYVLGAEAMPVAVALELPRSWRVATALEPTRDPRQFLARNAAALMEAPILAGPLREWRFTERGVPHRVVYWPLPDATPFDTSAFVSGIQRLVHQTFALFGRAPYREYTFLFQDGAYGGLEHPSSVTLGARSENLARDPNERLAETAHEFFHTWNLMAIKPAEYRDIDYRTQPPVSSLWFSEGVTLYYADLLLRRAGIPLSDSTRLAHLERVLARYAANPAYDRFSAEAISRVAYNAEPSALGDYTASTHLQGEVLATMLDFIVREATGGSRTLDDVMRALFARSESRIDGRVIEQTVERVCSCDVTPFFDAHVRGAQPLDFHRYLGLAGLRATTRWSPAVSNGEPERDLRIFGWEPGDGGVRLVISNPASIWGRAGLHSRDRLISVNGERIATWPGLRSALQRLRLGDTVRIAVERDAGPFEALVVVAGFERPTVSIAGTPDAIGRRWLEQSR